MAKTVDLEAYFTRIGYAGPRNASLDTLRALHLLHPAAIAFENLDPFLKRGVKLDLPSLEEKLVRGRRGGYCFEQNGLFLHVLGAMGFKAVGLAARVLRGRLEEESPRSHMLIRIELDDAAYIADVGFGSFALTAPLRLFDESAQKTPHGIFRLRPAGAEFEEQALVGGEWETQYRFSLHEQMMQDYEALNWYRATHPDSPFVNNLMVSRAPPGRRLGLFNNQFTVRDTEAGVISRRSLGTAGEIAEILVAEFGIALPEPRTDLERALARLVPAPT